MTNRGRRIFPGDFKQASKPAGCAIFALPADRASAARSAAVDDGAAPVDEELRGVIASLEDRVQHLMRDLPRSVPRLVSGANGTASARWLEG